MTTLVEPLLAILATMLDQLARLTKQVQDIVRQEAVCRRLMSVPGVGTTQSESGLELDHGSEQDHGLAGAWARHGSSLRRHCPIHPMPHEGRPTLAFTGSRS